MVDPDKPNKVKVGVTIDPKQRISAYRTANPQCYFYAKYSNIDKKHEKRILDLFKDMFRVDREYIHCNPSIAKNIIEGYFTDNLVNFK
jgi:hypothetical protein